MHPKFLFNEALSRAGSGCSYIRKLFRTADRFPLEVSNTGALDTITSPEPDLLRQAMVRLRRAFEPALMPPSHNLEKSMRNTELAAFAQSFDVRMKLSGRVQQCRAMAVQH